MKYQTQGSKNSRFENLRTLGVMFVVITIIVVLVASIVLISDLITLNAGVTTVEITVKEILNKDNVSPTVVDTLGNKYVATSMRDKIDFPSLVGEKITLIIPAKKIMTRNTIILGIIEGEDVLVDYNESLKSMKKNSLSAVGASYGTSAILLILALYCFISNRKRVNMESKPIEDCVWERWTNLPKSPTRVKTAKAFNLLMFVCGAIGLSSIILTNFESLKKIGEALGLTTLILLFFGIIIFDLMIFVYLPKDEIRFYKENYPFNMDEVSNQWMNKSLKKKFNLAKKEERAKHPDDFFDHANNYGVRFGEDGLHLFELGYDVEKETKFFEEINNDNSESEIFHCTIPYKKLNFIAIPKYRRFANMFGIIIKSRIDEKKSLPKEIEFDVHLFYDLNLQNTLKKFNVEVENLEYLLNNIETLMKENCKKSKVNFPSKR